MKKSSFFIGLSIMTLALVVAVVGVTAAWFGDIMEYRDGPIDVSSAKPQNDAIVVPDSSSDGSTGEGAVLAPARLKRGFQKSDVDTSWDFDSIPDLRNPQHEAIEEPATTDTVAFDFVYNGAPSNDDGVTTRMKIELISITLKNPLITANELDKDLNGDGAKDEKDVEIYLADNISYIENFGVQMYVTTDKSDVMIFNVPGTTNKYYTEITDGDDVLYQLNDEHYEINPDEPYTIYFDIVPVVHKLNATIWFTTLDEETPPELIDAQLFLNFQVSFLSNETEEGGENEG